MAAIGGFTAVAIKGMVQQGVPATPSCPSRAAGAVAAAGAADVVSDDEGTTR